MHLLNNAPLSDAVVRVLSRFAARENATVEEIVALARQLPAALGGSAEFPQETAIVKMVGPGSPSSILPAVPIDQSVSDESVTCLCCGRSFTMLKRHIKAEHGFTESHYRAQFGLSEDHPLVAPNYSIRKAEHAKRIGLGKYDRDDLPAETALPTA